MKPIIIGVLLAMLLAGCGSSNSTDSSTDTVLVDPAGIWLGTQTVLEKDAVGNVYSNAFDMKTLIYDGRFYGISEDANILFYGTYQLGTDGQMIVDGLEGGEHKYQMYSLDSGGESWVNGVARLQLTEKETLTGMFQNDAFQEGELQSHYSALYEKGASLDNLSGRYDTFDIAASGIISGDKNNCSVTGTVSVPDPTFNMYSLTYILEGENCIKAGSYSGLGTIAIDAQNQAYFMALSNSSDDTRMDGIYISLESTPLSFITARIDKGLSTFIGLAQGERISTKIRAALNIENWPDLVTPALADLSSLIQRWNPKDATNKDFVDLADIVYSASLTSSGGSADEVFYTIENTDFSGSSFNGVKFSLINEIPFGGNDNFYYDGFFVSLFDGANLKNVGFYGSVAQNSFVNANLEGSNWDRVYQNKWNDFSGAWWMDGHRCGIDLYLSIPDEDSGCTENYIDSGLTYEEWKSGKWEAEKIAENIGNKLKDIGNEGEKFVEEPLKTVGKWTGFW